MTYLMSLRGSVPKQSRSVRFCVRHEIATPAGLAMTYECAMSRRDRARLRATDGAHLRWVYVAVLTSTRTSGVATATLP
jgi:hypothetical protein